MATINNVHCCFICDQPFRAGEMVLSDVNEGLGHRACFGEDREGYVKDTDTGEPLGPNDPIPAGEPYDPADYAEPALRAVPRVNCPAQTFGEIDPPLDQITKCQGFLWVPAQYLAKGRDLVGHQLRRLRLNEVYGHLLVFRQGMAGQNDAGICGIVGHGRTLPGSAETVYREAPRW